MSLNPTPLDSSLLLRVRGQLGSNPAGIFRDSDGQDYYIKTLESPMHARNEWLAAKLYQLTGAPTLSYIPCKDPCQIATRWVELDKKHISHFNESERKQAQHWFAVHAWTANWDAAGFDGDNQGVSKKVVLTLDVGGALSYRACGDPKGRAFGTHVGELDVLRTNKDNPHALTLFSDMSAGDLSQAIQVVTDIPDDKICAVILNNGGSQKLVDKMIARKQDMLHRLRYLDGENPTARLKLFEK
ncbi:hypothetical protein DI392_06395 [Vibrio albus]|uniref:Uncharacterized protein n=1 Tax=Vibrio albus TaxID=2200953 RepID=A0A2U3BAK3_9VIBR|nr:hypothetical protein [Vibrio albus]PWI33829.1 hypothetical protein DI392_06395 [Vibrio albus]